MSPNNVPYGIPRTRYDQAVESGARWTRWPMYWNNIERSPGAFEFSAQDSVVDADRARGLKINAILVGTPGWGGTATAATGLPFDVSRKGTLAPELSIAEGSSPAAVPAGLDLPPFLANGSVNPENRWARAVDTIVRRYAGRVAAWEMWNEPDLRAGGAPVFWAGTPAQYARLLKVGYLVAKRADPSATVLFGGLAYFSMPEFFPRALDAIRADGEASANGWYFDAVGWHPYISPNNAIDFVNRARSQMRARGIDRPIWINETNIPVCDDKSVDPALSCPSLYRGTMDEQASYTVQLTALSAALGVEKLLFFQFYDDNVGPSEWYGFVRNDGRPRPALTAFATASRYLGSFRSATWQRSAAADLVQLGGVPDGGGTVRVSVLWSRGPATTLLVPAADNRDAGRLVDQLGAEAGGRLSRENGGYRVNLPAVTNPDLALGAPFFLIEPVDDDSTAPTARILSVGECRPASVGWSGSDNGWGIWNYDVETRFDEGPWVRWLSATTATSGSANGSGTRLGVRVRARDLAGNEGDWVTSATVTLRDCGTNAVKNGGFDDGLNNWTASGATPPVVSGGQVTLGQNFHAEAGQPFGNSTITQKVTLPASKPRLSFSYRIAGAGGCRAGWFEVLLAVGPNQATRVEYPVAPKTLWRAADWTSVSYDLSSYAGQDVNLIFNAVNYSGQPQTVVTIDNIGVHSSGAAVAAMPFTLFVPLAQTSSGDICAGVPN